MLGTYWHNGKENGSYHIIALYKLLAPNALFFWILGAVLSRVKMEDMRNVTQEDLNMHSA